MGDFLALYVDTLTDLLAGAWSHPLGQVAARLAAAGLALALALGACADIEDPDPCDPDCPPTTENPTGN